MFTFLRETGELISIKLISLFYTSVKMAKGYAELSVFALCKYNDGGLMSRVKVGRVGGRGKSYAIRVCISMEAWLNYYD